MVRPGLKIPTWSGVAAWAAPASPRAAVRRAVVMRVVFIILLLESQVERFDRRASCGAIPLPGLKSLKRKDQVERGGPVSGIRLKTGRRRRPGFGTSSGEGQEREKPQAVR